MYYGSVCERAHVSQVRPAVAQLLL